MLYYQHLRAPNDVNGNPRRVWVVYLDNGTVLATHDEGYGGRAIFREYRGDMTELPPIEVSPKEYKRWVKWKYTRAGVLDKPATNP